MATSCCPTGPYCDQCVAVVGSQLAGAAASRGVTWGRRIRARRRPTDPVVAFDTPRAISIARRWVADLSQDERVRADLIAACLHAAGNEFRSLTCRPSDLAQYRAGAPARRRP